MIAQFYQWWKIHQQQQKNFFIPKLWSRMELQLIFWSLAYKKYVIEGFMVRKGKFQNILFFRQSNSFMNVKFIQSSGYVTTLH